MNDAHRQHRWTRACGMSTAASQNTRVPRKRCVTTRPRGDDDPKRKREGTYSSKNLDILITRAILKSRSSRTIRSTRVERAALAWPRSTMRSPGKLERKSIMNLPA